eukprot:TRINITY_DN2471_c3_g1_i1.p1 TRINITY_DN2471_c3_g1~~TRINITY_DN2471_c3_g1_i1.p1  ORF type:complete len:632 (+),score=92.14 TRINITY_DN2471_c3_g1_i1:192-1898(+)
MAAAANVNGSAYTPAQSTNGLISGASTPSHFRDATAPFLNNILDHFWPRVSTYVSEMVISQVQPALEEALPVALQGLRLETCNFGTEPLQFRKVKIVKEKQVTASGDKQNLVFMARLGWDGDCDITLSFAGTRFGIKGLSIDGILLVELVGLMNQPPFFEGTRIFFNNVPEIDLEFQGCAAGIVNSSVVRNKIVEVVTNSIMDIMVVPNRMGYSVVPDADIFMIKSPPAQGLLTLTIWSAQDLPSMDTTWFGGVGKADPYVVIHCGSFTSRSPTIYKTLNPQWEHKVAVLIFEPNHQRVKIEVSDEDLLTHDDFIGKLTIPVSEMLNWGEHLRVVKQLIGEDDKPGRYGKISMSASYRPLEIGIEKKHSPAASGLIFVGIHSASKVPAHAKGTTYWAVVRCSNPLSGFCKNAYETDRIVQQESTSEEPTVDQLSMKSRLLLLQNYGLSQEDMATVLQVDEQSLQSALLHHSKTSAAVELAQLRTHDVLWECGRDFPVESVTDSFVTIELYCQEPSKKEKILGSLKYSISDLMTYKNWTTWMTEEIEGSCIMLKVKLGVRFLGAPQISI